MKTMRLVGPVLFVISVLAAVAFTQATVKVAVMNTYAFGDEKTGITKLVVAQKGVDAAFKQVDDGLKAMQTKLNGLTTEIDNYRKNPVGVDEKAAQAKIDEAASLDRQIKHGAEDAKAKYERRQEAMIGPVMQDIYKAAQEFSTQKGYLMMAIFAVV